eukprot:351328-Chlamydomonas_euryale.AAC.8
MVVVGGRLSCASDCCVGPVILDTADVGGGHVHTGGLAWACSLWCVTGDPKSPVYTPAHSCAQARRLSCMLGCRPRLAQCGCVETPCYLTDHFHATESASWLAAEWRRKARVQQAEILHVSYTGHNRILCASLQAW